MQPLNWLKKTEKGRFRAALSRWFRKNGRSLPWRKTTDPYSILVSEIMLQQTLVATVIRYYDRFLSQYPTVSDLAKADDAAVLRSWEGLGYYRRARNLHAAAKEVMAEHHGEFPNSPIELRKLAGLGKYTANAVACFSQDLRAPILEANTLRLWSRLCASEGDPSRQPLNGQLWKLAEEILPEKGSADFNQSLMDLGSLICTPANPKCENCPVQSFCTAFAKDEVEKYPQLAKKTPAELLNRVCVLIEDEGAFLIRQRPAEGRWAGLWEFPSDDMLESEDWLQAATRIAGEFMGRNATIEDDPIEVRHGLLHYKVTLRCYRVNSLTLGSRKASQKMLPVRPANKSVKDLNNPVVAQDERGTTGNLRWVRLEALHSFAFSSPQRRIVEMLTRLKMT